MSVFWFHYVPVVYHLTALNAIVQYRCQGAPTMPSFGVSCRPVLGKVLDPDLENHRFSGGNTGLLELGATPKYRPG